jgi:hypothetical protein
VNEDAVPCVLDRTVAVLSPVRLEDEGRVYSDWCEPRVPLLLKPLIELSVVGGLDAFLRL